MVVGVIMAEDIIMQLGKWWDDQCGGGCSYSGDFIRQLVWWWR